MASVRFSHSARSRSLRSIAPNSSPPTSCVARPPAIVRGMVFRFGLGMVRPLGDGGRKTMPPRPRNASFKLDLGKVRGASDDDQTRCRDMAGSMTSAALL